MNNFVASLTYHNLVMSKQIFMASITLVFIDSRVFDHDDW